MARLHVPPRRGSDEITCVLRPLAYTTPTPDPPPHNATSRNVPRLTSLSMSILASVPILDTEGLNLVLPGNLADKN